MGASFADAIAAIESRGSGDYAALGPVTSRGDRAYGRYQVMGANIPQWSQAALGRTLTPQEFLSDKAAQDAVFNHRFGGYVQKTGSPADAASMWFTGQPLAKGAGRADQLGTTGQAYADKFIRALGGPTTPVAAAGAAPQPASPAQGAPGLAPPMPEQPGGGGFDLGGLLAGMQEQPTGRPDPRAVAAAQAARQRELALLTGQGRLAALFA